MVLFVLLAALAALQYHWLGQVSEGERERLRTNLRAGSNRLREDFDRELADLHRAFQGNADEVRARGWDIYAAKHEAWAATAIHPRLVRGIYLVAENEDGSEKLALLDHTSKRFELTTWTPELMPVRSRLRDQRSSQASLPNRIVRFLTARDVAEVPALLIPVLDIPLRPGRIEMQPNIFALGYIVVLLDLEQIRQNLLPELVARYFADGDTLDYHIAVSTRTEPAKIIYRSDADTPVDLFTDNDVSITLFNLQLTNFTVAIPRGAEQTNGGTNVAQTRTTVVIRTPRGQASELPANNRVPVIVAGDDASGWQMAVKHRAGSLEAAVANTRRRNLLVSFGVLLLLATSVVLVVIYTQRTQRLAGRQMEFVAGITHELRTPLAVVCSAGENLADGIVKDVHQVRDYGRLIKNEGRRLTEMVEEALEFAGAERGRVTHDLQLVDVRLVIDDALSSCAAQIGEGGFHIERFVEADVPPVLGDPRALVRVVQNLLSNAMKYSGGNHGIEIRARRSIDKQGHETVAITIEDHGLGIDSRDLPRIFEPFYRGREAVTTQTRGNGLGLNLVKRIVEAHGGTVAVESTIGHGSSFTLHLPASDNGDG